MSATLRICHECFFWTTQTTKAIKGTERTGRIIQMYTHGGMATRPYPISLQWLHLSNPYSIPSAMHPAFASPATVKYSYRFIYRYHPLNTETEIYIRDAVLTSQPKFSQATDSLNMFHGDLWCGYKCQSSQLRRLSIKGTRRQDVQVPLPVLCSLFHAGRTTCM